MSDDGKGFEGLCRDLKVVLPGIDLMSHTPYEIDNMLKGCNSPIGLKPYQKVCFDVEEDGIMKAVASVGVEVDKDKLMQALEADQNRYNEAYREGFRVGAKNAEITPLKSIFALQLCSHVRTSEICYQCPYLYHGKDCKDHLKEDIKKILEDL